MDKIHRKKRPNLGVDNENETDLEVVVFGKKVKTKTTDETTKKSKSGTTGESSKKVQRYFEDRTGTVDVEELQEKPEQKGVWIDDDDNIDVNSAFQDPEKYPRKVESSQKYKHYLESKFKELNATPKWSLKKKGEKAADSSDEEDDGLERTVGDFISKTDKLSKGVLNIRKCPNLNSQKPFKTLVSSVQFHPLSTVALVATPTGTVNLFQVDGKTNAKIQTIHFEKFEVEKARFTADGEQLIVGSKMHSGHYYYYDMIGGRIVRVPFVKGKERYCLRNFILSSDGKYIVSKGKQGFVYLIANQSKEVAMNFKMNSDVSSFTFNEDCSKLFTHGSEGKVYVWDIRNSQRCVHRFIDQGCINGTSITISPNQQYMATGSDSGVVNVYNYNDVLSQSEPLPTKALMNLTTEITCLKFNHTSEILTMSSSYKAESIRFVHFPSTTVFSNFPHFGSNYKMITEVDMSLNSGYVTFGTNRGHAQLFRLLHFNNY